MFALLKDVGTEDRTGGGPKSVSLRYVGVEREAFLFLNNST